MKAHFILISILAASLYLGVTVLAQAATLEGATYTPALSDVPVGRDDSAFSAIERIFVFTNVLTGADNPQRQGLNSAIMDGRSPLKCVGWHTYSSKRLQSSLGCEPGRMDQRIHREGL